MPKTTLIFDCHQLARSVASVGGSVPDSLGHLLSAHEVLTAPASTERPENAIVDAALAGTLDAKTLAKLLPAAARAHSENQYRQQLLGDTERILVAQFHRELEAGGADLILDSMRGAFNKAAEGIAHARSVGINAESSPEHILATGSHDLAEAWNALTGQIRVVSRIGSVAAQFGPRPQASFPQTREFAAGHTHLLDDRAIMCTDGGLVAESQLFMRPDQGHRTSPWARCSLKLLTIAEAQARLDEWAAYEFDRIHSGPRGGRIIDGEHVLDPLPPNPYRESANA